jgi:UDP-glucose 4-epimerase
MRTLVIGGAGFIGRHLVAACRAAGDEVTVFDLCAGNDVRDAGGLYRVFRDFKPELVYHLAAQTEVRRSYKEPCLTFETNVIGTWNVLEACQLFGTKKLIYASTDKVYGQWPGPCSEGAHSLPRDIYSVTKHAADDIVQVYSRTYGLDTVTLRCANTFGPGQHNGTTLITATVQSVLRGQKPMLFKGSEKARREWLYVDDAVKAYMAVRGRCENTVYNVGTGEVFSVETVVQAVLKCMEKPADWYELVEVEEAPQAPVNVVSSRRFRTDFPTWMPIRFPEALKRTVEWYASNT